MRTVEQIEQHINDIAGADFFGVMTGDLVEFLPYEKAKKHLRDDVTAEAWAEARKPLTDEAVLAEMLRYMPFAWEKANHCRGLSAGRSINHMQAWLWLLGHEQAAKDIEDYDLYGKPQLRAICEAFGWDWTIWDDGAWRRGEEHDGDQPPASVPALVLGLAA